MSKSFKHRGFNVHREGNAWKWIYEDYDGAPDSSTRNWFGTSSSREQAIEEIDEIVDDAELDKSESFTLNNGSMSIGTPQLIIVAMMLFNLGFVAAKHGKKRPEYDGWSALICHFYGGVVFLHAINLRIDGKVNLQSLQYQKGRFRAPAFRFFSTLTIGHSSSSIACWITEESCLKNCTSFPSPSTCATLRRKTCSSDSEASIIF